MMLQLSMRQVALAGVILIALACTANAQLAGIGADEQLIAGPSNPIRYGGCEYAVDDGALENAIGMAGPHGGSFGWLNAFTTSSSECSVVRAVEVVWGSPTMALANGAAARVHVWEDPNDDGNPADAVLLADVDVIISRAGTGLFVSHAIPPTQVSGVFFVGASTRHTSAQRPAALDQTIPRVDPPVSWSAGNNGFSTFNAHNLLANDGARLELIADSGFPGEWLVRASGSARITYQGKLDDSGAPITGPIDATFAFYEGPVGGDPIQVTTHGSVSVEDGLFTVEIPINSPDAINGAERWLEISIANPSGSDFVIMSPRQRLTSAPMAIHASNADNAAVAAFATTSEAALSAVALSAPLPWSNLSGVPAGFADGTDNIGGDGHSLDASDGFPANTVYVNADGRVGIGTEGPLADLHVVSSSAELNNVIFGTADSVFDNGTTCLTLAGSVRTPNMQVEYDGARRDLAIYGQVTSTTRVGPWVTIDRDSGRVGIGSPASSSPDGQLELDAGVTGVTPLVVKRVTTDGPLIDFRRNSTSVGTISVAAGVVTYGAFTGVHYARGATDLPRGTLVRMSGVNERISDAASEIIYGVAVTSHANDPAVLGAYLASPVADGEDPHDLVMSVGNGEMWVIDTGRDVAPGDALISSGLSGCAMLDDPKRYEVGYVVARAAEPVDWSRVAPGSDGVKRALVSVLFDRFTRSGDPIAIGAELDALRAENGELRARLEALEAAVRGAGKGGGR